MPKPPGFEKDKWSQAANHNRLCLRHDQQGINLFVYGKTAIGSKQENAVSPSIYPARQTKESSQAIARKHRIDPEKLIFAQQNPKAIDKGVFHNDVISVANESVFLVHQEAFYQQSQVLSELRTKANFPLQIIEIPNERLSVEEAVETYFFNSQLLTLPEQEQMVFIAPIECKLNERANQCIQELVSDSNNPISAVHFLDLKQSMRNGGGPACLRLRVALTEIELNAMHQGVLVTEPLLILLEAWVNKYYRSELTAKDLLDPQLMNESFGALDELTHILQLGSIYPFQNQGA